MDRINTRLLSIGTLLTTSVLLMGCGGSSLLGRVSGFWRYGICSGLVVILDIIALVEVWGGNRTKGDKLLWSLLIVVFPIVGCLLYYFIGRK